MAVLPDVVREGWNDRKGAVVLTTVDRDGCPNSIYAGCVSMFAPDKLVVADNYFQKTRANLQAGCKGSLLFITNQGKAYQVKGTLEYHQQGEIFDDMKTWNTKHPGHAAAVLNVEEVYCGAEKLA